MVGIYIPSKSLRSCVGELGALRVLIQFDTYFCSSSMLLSGFTWIYLVSTWGCFAVYLSASKASRTLDLDLETNEGPTTLVTTILLLPRKAFPESVNPQFRIFPCFSADPSPLPQFLLPEVYTSKSFSMLFFLEGTYFTLATTCRNDEHVYR